MLRLYNKSVFENGAVEFAAANCIKSSMIGKNTKKWNGQCSWIAKRDWTD